MREGKYRPFSREPIFAVVRAGRHEEEIRRTPRVRIDDECMFLAIRLAKEGYFNGNPQEVLNAPVDVVQAIIEYGGFASDYESEYVSLNDDS